MAEWQVVVRELNKQLSKHLRQVRAGRSIVITDYGKPVGRIAPASQTLDDEMHAMVAAGLAEWNGKKLKPGRLVARVKAGHSVGEIMLKIGYDPTLL